MQPRYDQILVSYDMTWWSIVDIKFVFIALDQYNWSEISMLRLIEIRIKSWVFWNIISSF